LLFTAFGALLTAAALLLGLLRTNPDLTVLVVTLSNAVLLFSHAMIWAAFRAFSRRRQKPGWMVAGSLAWVALALWPPFHESAALRIGVSSLICNLYLALALRGIWRLRREGKFGVWPAAIVLGWQILFYFYRMLTERSSPIQDADQAGFALTMFESILFAVCLSFVVLMMVR